MEEIESEGKPVYFKYICFSSILFFHRINKRVGLPINIWVLPIFRYLKDLWETKTSGQLTIVWEIFTIQEIRIIWETWTILKITIIWKTGPRTIWI